MHAYLCAYPQAHLYTYMPTNLLPTYLHTYLSTRVHRTYECIRTCIHADMEAYRHESQNSLLLYLHRSAFKSLCRPCTESVTNVLSNGIHTTVSFT